MSIPDYPENRREEYLNNIATGSGEIPPYPENREEQYLDAIARNGGGGGSGGGVLVVHDVDGTLDKTWQEIHDADLAILKVGDTIGYLCSLSDNKGCSVKFFSVLPSGDGFDDPLPYVCANATDYPTWIDE